MTPKSRKVAQRLCGFINWFRLFIPSLSTIAKPITDKLQNGTKFIWNHEDTEIAKKILNRIRNSEKLGYADYKLPFILETDGSDYGMGAVF